VTIEELLDQGLPRACTPEPHETTAVFKFARVTVLDSEPADQHPGSASPQKNVSKPAEAGRQS
jgi:hypothetical protein